MIPAKTTLYEKSTYKQDGTTYFLVKRNADGKKLLCIEGDTIGFTGEKDPSTGILLCPLTSENAKALRTKLSFLNPLPMGLATSFGFGDRMGTATPGHIAATESTKIAPIFAQQSVRENDRTGRSPQIVLDDAMWGIFQEGWHRGWGADADHVKGIPDLPPFLEAGYTFYTIDPGDHVDNASHTDVLDTLKEKAGALPWSDLGTNREELQKRYTQSVVELEDSKLEFTEEVFLRAAGKYVRAIIHAKKVADHLVAQLGHGNFDLEVSVDETDTPTSVHEHFFIANELRRLEVPFVSLAPRFIGSFEKGVDYIGDIEQFEIELEQNVKVMHHLGGYKLSVHTGSDKFSIYPIIAKHTNNLVHVKTAGTSYLEALRVIATAEPGLFREILDFSRSRYEIDRATYHVSGILDKVPAAGSLVDEGLPGLLDQFDARQVLHVTFGSVLDTFGNRFHPSILENLDLYRTFLKKHFKRHLEPFIK